MNVQGTLTEDAPLILDATCSFPHGGGTPRYPAFASLRMDVRREVKPDLVADARFMPFRDGVFAKVYCDPPHMFGNGKSKKNLDNIRRYRARHGHKSLDSFTRYSFWPNKEAWASFVRMTNHEFARVLAEGGRLHYKITDTESKATTSSKDLERMTNFEVEADYVTASIPFGNDVHWLTMRPKP